MTEQVETLQQQLKEQEKLASLGMLSAGIAHEIQNPLNFVINFSKMSSKLLDDLTDIVDDNREHMPQEDSDEVGEIVDDLKENLAKIVEHGERAISIIQGILLVSRGREDEFVAADIAAIVHEYVWLSYHAMRASHKGFNASIHEDYADTAKAVVVPQDISRAVLNLMNNAYYTLWHKSQQQPEGYTPRIDVSVSQQGSDIVVRIADNGEGMTDEVSQRLYDNFFTTKPVGQGTGLGMAITRDIIENKHHGRLTFETQAGEGTCFTMTFPIQKQ